MQGSYEHMVPNNPFRALVLPPLHAWALGRATEQPTSASLEQRVAHLVMLVGSRLPLQVRYTRHAELSEELKFQAQPAGLAAALHRICIQVLLSTGARKGRPARMNLFVCVFTIGVGQSACPHRMQASCRPGCTGRTGRLHASAGSSTVDTVALVLVRSRTLQGQLRTLVYFLLIATLRADCAPTATDKGCMACAPPLFDEVVSSRLGRSACLWRSVAAGA